MVTFEIFNFNVHNCLVDSGALVKIIPLSVTNKINVEWDKKNSQMILLDKTHVHATGELRYVIIRLPSYGRVHQCINIVILDIPES